MNKIILMVMLSVFSTFVYSDDGSVSKTGAVETPCPAGNDSHHGKVETIDDNKSKAKTVEPTKTDS